MKNHRLLETVVAGGMALALAAPAFANSESSEATTSAVDSVANDAVPETQRASGLEDIIVTAQRSEARLQDVPIAVTAITATALANKGITSTLALEVSTPGLQVSRQSQALSPYIRGIGTQYASIPGLEAPVALYVDGVYYPNNAGNVLSFNSIQRVEVLKGPQGTLFGRNSTGGLISVTTRDPSVDTMVEGKLSYGNYDTVEGSLYATTGVGNVAMDIAVDGVHQGNGFGRNVTTGKDIERQRSISVRSKLRWEASDSDVLTAAFDWTKDRSDMGLAMTGAPGSILLDGLPGERPNYSRGERYDPALDLTAWTASLRYEHSFDWGTLTSTTAYRDEKDVYDWDVDGTPFPILPVISGNYSRSFQQEFLFTGKADRFNWTAGVFIFDAQQGNNVFIYSDVIPEANRNLQGEQNTRSYSAFAQATYELTSRTNITGGFRYTIDRRNLNGTVTALAGNPVSAGTVLETELTDNKKTFKNPSWRLTIDHKLTEDVMVYGRYDRGFKSGVYNVSVIGAPAINPEKLDAFEIGLKSELFDHLLRFNAAAFHYKYSGIQLGTVDGSGTSQVINAAAAKLKGFEVEAVLAPRVDFGHLEFNAGVSVLDAHYKSFPDGPFNTPNPAGGNTQSSADLSGNRLPHAPKFTLTLGADFSVPIGAGTFGASANYYYNDGFYWEPDQSFVEPSYDVINAQIYYAFGAEEQFRIRAFGRNLGNTHYGIAGFASAVGNMYSYAAPRTYGVGFNFKF
ncbi:iron complex outermembrane recepter protein [Sphingobium faniae]|nr:iron complex outermembrane recepter protein [Sphingobium faniae]